MMKIHVYDIISEVWTEIGDALALVPRRVFDCTTYNFAKTQNTIFFLSNRPIHTILSPDIFTAVILFRSAYCNTLEANIEDNSVSNYLKVFRFKSCVSITQIWENIQCVESKTLNLTED